MASKKKQALGKSDDKFTLGQFAWNGFNLTVGVAFIGSLAATAQGNGFGLWIFLVFILIGLTAGACAFAFAKLSRYHKADSNGGAYIFARGSFGRFIGFLTLFLNYILMPLVLSNQILMFIKANFNPAMATSTDGTAWWNEWVPQLKGWGNLTYDCIGIALSVVFVLVAFFGTKLYKKVAKYSLIVKWVTGGFFILCGLVVAFLPATYGHGANASGPNISYNMHYWWYHSSMHIGSLLTAFCTCFYYFTGFESFATSAATVKEPEKNIGKGIMIVIIIATLFYIVEAAIFMMAVSPDTVDGVSTGGISQNMSTGFWSVFGEQAKWMMYLGPIVMIVSTLALRGNAISQITLYGGTTLQPMSVEGYVSDNFGTQNEAGFPIGAMKLNLIISAITVVTWAIVPDIIVGALNPNPTMEQLEGKQPLVGDFINVNSIINPASVFYIAIYMLVLLTVLKHGIKGIIKLNAIEWILYTLSLGLLGVVFGYHFYDLFESAFGQPAGVNVLNNIVSLIVELAFITLCILFVALVYFCYYKKKYAIRLKKNPAKQKTLNYEFRLFDGWDFLKGKLHLSATNFFKKRSKLVNDNTNQLSNSEFQAKYKEMAEQFTVKTQKQLTTYLKYSERIKMYNIAHKNDNHGEIDANQKSSSKYLSQVQARIKTQPSDWIGRTITHANDWVEWENIKQI